ncbi:MAG TPA: penicillin acylase family protein [Mucilaginibacter sp.]
MKIFKALLSIIVTIALIWLLQTKLGDIPPVGKFLNPVSGFWQNAETKNAIGDENLKLTGLQGKVTIRYDGNRIPHLFADNDHDLYFAQGYVTARDRLWQLDIQTRSASGRLAEIIGPKALGVDQYHRRMGMVYGAENTLRGMMKDPVIKMILEAYTDGVNSYIHQLSPKDYPIEFKLLDYTPEDWKPINCAFLLKLMSETLAGGSSQFAMTNTLKHFGASITNDLFPDEQFHEDPIIPVGTKWNFKPVTIPKPSASYLAQMTDSVKTVEKKEGIGSNNWAVSGGRTANGYPILANDPHLNLTFPSIWYQLQMSSPTVNVYGVSLPGAPCVIVGYNQKISWGVTNVDADVLDWYQVKFKDANKNEYWYKNQWNKVTRRIEAIKVRGQKTVYDTVIYTHHGPVVYETTAQKAKGSHQNVPAGNALRWIAHDESDEFLTFYQLNRGKNYADYREALAHFTAPAQNFVFASIDNEIAITANGKFPLKFKDQGKYIMDGSDPANDWQGWIPADQNPTVKNPPRGFVSSANQSSTDKTYPYYLNWDFGNYDRGKRVNDRLTRMQKANADSMRLMQADNYSIRAQDVLPTMLKYLEPSKMDNVQRAAYLILKNWDNRFDANAIGATIFSNWWDKFYLMIWNDDFKNSKTLLKYPSFDRTEKLLLAEPNSRWFDNTLTAEKETCADLLSIAFNLTIDELNRKLGKPGKAWEWGAVKITHINHLANLDGFGTGDFSAGGTNGVINALHDGSGPSWRMVVQMGPVVKGYGIFPGGESGNPGSFYYDDMFQTWKDDKLNELLFLQSPDENSNRIKSTLTLTK